jgi:hypothetical protein
MPPPPPPPRHHPDRRRRRDRRRGRGGGVGTAAVLGGADGLPLLLDGHQLRGDAAPRALPAGRHRDRHRAR